MKIARQPATAAMPAPIVGAMIGTIMKTRKISDSLFAIASPKNRSRITATTITPSAALRSEEHTSELQSLMRISYAVFCLKKKRQKQAETHKPYRDKCERVSTPG